MLTHKFDFDNMTIYDQEAVLIVVNEERRRLKPNWSMIETCERWLRGFAMFKGN